MDAHAHLLSLGWAGPGHALDSRPTKAYKQQGKQGLDYNPKQNTNTGTGLVKPLMISQRKDRFGIGRKDPKHEPAAGNEWWLKGFETALSNIGKSESERSGTATPVQAQANGQKHQGLYGFFIKGQKMEGTIGQELLRRSRKRKSDQINDDRFSDDEEPHPEKKDGTEDYTQAAAFMAVRDKDKKQQRRAERAGAFQEFQQAAQFFEARSDTKKKKRRSQVEVVTDEPIATVSLFEVTKEERRERQRKLKDGKAAKEAGDAEEHDPRSKSQQADTSKRKHKDKRRREKGLTR